MDVARSLLQPRTTSIDTVRAREAKASTSARVACRGNPINVQQPGTSRRLELLQIAAVSSPVDKDATTSVLQQTTSASGAALQADRRRLLLGAALFAASVPFPWPSGTAAAAEAGAVEGSGSIASMLVPYTNVKQGYSLFRPMAFEQVEKAGADVLFRHPGRSATALGVTVAPTRLSSLQQFGSVDQVAERLLDAERAKDSTLPGGVRLLSKGSRPSLDIGAPLVAEGSSSGNGVEGAPVVYTYEYEVASTRGRNRVIAAVAVARGMLYILNGQVRCSSLEEGGCEFDGASIEAMRKASASFAVA